MIADFSKCKICDGPTALKYDLKGYNVLTCSECGFHFIDYLDDVNAVDPHINTQALTPEMEETITHFFHHNMERATTDVDLIFKYLGNRQEIKMLDVGCGGGLILHLCEKKGAEVFGIEFQDSFAAYCKKMYGLENIYKIPLEDSFWQDNYRNSFDVITFMDVVEHVNSPLDTLRSAVNLLKPGGILLLSTPCRDTFYHRFGEISYSLSKGKYPTFLPIMYSNTLFSHKQILSLKDMDHIFQKLNLESVHSAVVHEHGYPLEYYLRRILRSERLAKLATPVVKGLFTVCPIKNKMILAARKR